MSFQQFVQLAAHEAVPDETSLCRFRQRLITCGLHELLLALLNTQLEACGYSVVDIAQTAELLHGQEKQVHADAGCTGVEK